jgi:hypothetical protein
MLQPNVLDYHGLQTYICWYEGDFNFAYTFKHDTVNFSKDFIPGLLEDLLDQWPRQSANFYLLDWENTAAESVEDHLVQTITAVCTRTEMNNRKFAFCLSEAWQTFLNQLFLDLFFTSCAGNDTADSSIRNNFVNTRFWPISILINIEITGPLSFSPFGKLKVASSLTYFLGLDHLAGCWKST